MKRDPKLSSELLIKPLDVSFVQVKKKFIYEKFFFMKSNHDLFQNIRYAYVGILPVESSSLV